MEWFKGRSSFIIGSDRWLGGQSSSTSTPSMPVAVPPEGVAKQSEAEEHSNEQHSVVPKQEAAEKTKEGSSSFYPSVSQYNPLSGLKVRSPNRDSPKLYPEVYKPENEGRVEVTAARTEAADGDILRSIETGTSEAPHVGSLEPTAPLEAAEELIITIPQAMAHLIDHQESVLLASGDFSVVRLSQNGTAVALFVRVGSDLQWPLVKDAPATKLDSSHYVFSIRVDAEDEEDGRSKQASPATDTLNYGITFKVDGNKEMLEVLDAVLEQYSYFSAPAMLQASEEEIKKLDASKVQESAPEAVGKPIPKEVSEKKPSVEMSTAYWTTLAPNVDDYNSSLARAIASGTGHIIRGIFWCSDTTVSQLEKGGKFMKRRSAACTEPTTVNPSTVKNIRRAKRVTKMSEKVAKGVLTGIVSVTGYFTTTLVNSSVGKKFFKLMPGEVALASLEGFGRIFDAIEVAGTNVLNTSSVVTTAAVSHRYGEQAAEATSEGLSAAGHLFGVAWTISKLRNAINPKNAIRPSAVLRTAAKAAASGEAKK